MVNTKYSRVGGGRGGGGGGGAERIPWTDTTFLENLSTCEHAYNFFALKNTPRNMLNYPVLTKKW